MIGCIPVRNSMHHTGKCIRRFGGIHAYCRYFIDRKWYRYWCYYYIEKHAICLKDYKIRSFLSIQYVNGDLCKHLGIDSSTDHLDRYSNLFLNTDHLDRYSNLFLNAYINRHVHAQYLKMI